MGSSLTLELYTRDSHQELSNVDEIHEVAIEG